MPLKFRRGWLLGGSMFAIVAAIEGPALLHRHRRALETDGRSRALRLAWPHAGTDGLLAAARDGVFARYGLDVTIVPVENGLAALDLLARAEVDGAAASLLDLLPRQDAGANAAAAISDRILLGMEAGTYRVIANRDANVHRVSDLAGRSIGVARLSGAPQRFAQIRLRRRGVDPLNGVKWVQVAERDFAAALDERRVDAVVTRDPSGWELLATTRGQTVTVIDSMTGAERDRTDLVLSLRAGLLNDDPDLGATLILALRDAAASWGARRAAFADKLSDMEPPVPDAARMLAQYVPPRIVTGHDLVIQVEQYADEMKLIGVFPDSKVSSAIAHALCYRPPNGD